MRLDLDAKIRTSDGEEVGDLQWAIVDPQGRTVTHLVVNAADLIGRTVEIPLEAIDEASADGDELRLRLSKAEFERLSEHLPAQYGGPPPGWHPIEAWALPTEAFRWPIYPAQAQEAMSLDTETASGGEIGVEKGALVFDVNGDEVGSVDDVQFDSHSGRVRHIVVRSGNSLITLFGGGETAEIPAEHIDRIVEGAVHLSASKDALGSRS